MATWFITGCSSGLGKSLAKAVLDAGHNAVITARDKAKLLDLENAYPDTAAAASLDIANAEQMNAALALADDRFGGIDVLVNNAGHGYRSAVEEGEEDAVAELFETNFFGPVRLIKAALPAMRARNSGQIVNVSSIAGRLSNAGSGYYSATKFALEGMSDALRKEVGPLGIDVMVVDPGPFRTEFSGRSLKQTNVKIDDYAQTAGLRRKENDKTHGTQRGDPDRAAVAIIKALASDKVPFRFLMGVDAIKVVEAELAAQSKEISDWETLSLSTDFPEGT